MNVDISAYQHLWDGSQPGWRLLHIDELVHRVTFQFGPGGPSGPEIVSLRQMLDELRDQSTKQILQTLKGRQSYEIPRDFSNLEVHHVVESAESHGFAVEVASRQIGGYRMISPAGEELPIDDSKIADAVAGKMLDAGIIAEQVCVD